MFNFFFKTILLNPDGMNYIIDACNVNVESRSENCQGESILYVNSYVCMIYVRTKIITPRERMLIGSSARYTVIYTKK